MSGFVLLSDETLAAPAASMTATVDTAYRMFRVTFYGIKDGTGGLVQYRFNGDSGANYALEYILANDTTVSAERKTGETQLAVRAIAFTANATGIVTIEIEKPLATTPARCTSSAAIISTNIRYEADSGEWANTADLIDEITVLASAGNFAIGSRLLVEGVEP